MAALPPYARAEAVLRHRTHWILLASVMIIAALATRAFAQGNLKTVEEEIEDLRGKLVELNSELDSLEQDLLVPRTSAIKIFLTSTAGKQFQLQSVKVLVDDRMVGTHVYRAEENMALQNGGAQSLFEGHVSAGDHTIIAQFTGVDLIQNRINKAIRFKVKGKERTLSFVELRVGYSTDKKRPDFTYEIHE